MFILLIFVNGGTFYPIVVLSSLFINPNWGFYVILKRFFTY